MKQYTIEDFAGFEKNKLGYTICPPGDYTAIKEFPAKCSFGEYCSFGKRCRFGEWCSFGEECGIGERCSFGKGCSFGERCSFGESCRFGGSCKCEDDKELKALFTVGYIGSRKGTSYFWHLADGSILVRCGCFCGDLDEFTAKVKETHGDPLTGTGNRYAKEYMAAIELAKVRFGEEEEIKEEDAQKGDQRQ